MSTTSACQPLKVVYPRRQLLQEVYEILFTPKVNPNWQSTLLIVTFDEHGGCYEHVPPFPAPLPTASAYGKVAANASGPPFDRYGVRVPTILVSSQIKPGTIFRQTTQVSEQPTAYLDHTSIIRTVFDWLLPDASPPVSLTNRNGCAPSVAAALTEPLARIREFNSQTYNGLPRSPIVTMRVRS